MTKVPTINVTNASVAAWFVVDEMFDDVKVFNEQTLLVLKDRRDLYRVSLLSNGKIMLKDVDGGCFNLTKNAVEDVDKFVADLKAALEI